MKWASMVHLHQGIRQRTHRTFALLNIGGVTSEMGKLMPYCTSILDPEERNVEKREEKKKSFERKCRRRRDAVFSCAWGEFRFFVELKPIKKSRSCRTQGGECAQATIQMNHCNIYPCNKLFSFLFHQSRSIGKACSTPGHFFLRVLGL